MTMTIDEARQRDAADPLRAFRARFDLPPGIIYLDGNSLGPLPRATRDQVADMVDRQWGRDLIAAWNDHGWIDAPRRIGAKIAALIGAAEDEVMVADSTSVNIFKLLTAAARANPGRTEILAEAANFPTDLHIAAGVANLLGLTLVTAPPDDLADAIGANTAAVILPDVHYRSAARYDMAAMNARAQKAGTHIVWDLSHSAGAVPVDLSGCGTMLAVGCGYKFLNGGPGAPAFVHVAREWQDRLHNPLQGWLGHKAPFDFADAYEPAPGMGRWQAGTPPMLSMAALESGVDLMLEADMNALFAKSAALFDAFAARMAEKCPALTLASPREAERRGSHISFLHEDAFPIVQAAIARGVIGDFRTPDIARFGLTPLYTGFEDVARAADTIAEIIATGAWREDRFRKRGAVT